MNLRTFDLNLLRVLDAMLGARNTTRVAESIGLTQPAVSAALRRLRESLGDPLFVREGNALVPTPFAAGLQKPVHDLLGELETLLSGAGGFTPATSTRAFTVLGSDYFDEMLMPRLAARLTGLAPGMKLKLLPPDLTSFANMLSAGRADMVLSVNVPTPDWIERQLMFAGGFVVVARQGHPRLARLGLGRGEMLPLEAFCDIPQAIFSVDDAFVRPEDEALAALGRQRRVAISVGGFQGVARVVADSDLLGVLPTRFALAVAPRLGLTVHRLPFEAPLVGMFLYWHKRDSADREHAWLRGLVGELLSPQDEIVHPVRTEEFTR